MGREEIIRRINALSEDDLAVVAPYLVADLDAVHEIEVFAQEVERGEQSARLEPLVDDEDVVRSVLERLREA